MEKRRAHRTAEPMNEDPLAAHYLGAVLQHAVGSHPIQEGSMSYAIIGSGKVGQALATAFARKEIEVGIASRRPPEALEPVAKAIGPTIIPKSLQDALKAEIILLAIPFGTYKDLAKAAMSWQGKIVIDVTNAYGISPKELGNLPSSVVMSRALPGAKLVKAFNHLPAETLAEDPSVEGGRRVLFLSSDDESAATRVAELVEQLGFAPVRWGALQREVYWSRRGETLGLRDFSGSLQEGRLGMNDGGDANMCKHGEWSL